jgi:16S rRNA (guanine527-N7)-methyltransferase
LSLNLERFRETLQEANLNEYFPANSLLSLVTFTQKMLEINKTLNLTRWTKDEDVLTYHFLDSAYGLPLLDDLKQKTISDKPRWLDLGTGCGFPGAVLAAAFPSWEITFLDSVRKKIKALEECVSATNWDSKFLSLRAEELGKDIKTRESWNGITARAIADFRVVLEYAIPLLTIGGYLVNWMTEEQLSVLERSEKALHELNAKVIKKSCYSLPHSQKARWIVVVEKMGITSKLYPRAIGKASKLPL